MASSHNGIILYFVDEPEEAPASQKQYGWTARDKSWLFDGALS